MSWYAFFVETGKEERIKRYIYNTMSPSATGIPYELLIAKREIREKREGITKIIYKSMFPGYILIETKNILDFYIKLKSKRCEHCFGVLRNGEYFKEVRLEEISKIVYMIDSDGVIGSSDVFVEKDRIIVTKGPLKNYDGFIKKINRSKNRVKVLFPFNGEKHYIDLSVNFIEKLDDSSLSKEIPFINKPYYL